MRARISASASQVNRRTEKDSNSSLLRVDSDSFEVSFGDGFLGVWDGFLGVWDGFLGVFWKKNKEKGSFWKGLGFRDGYFRDVNL